MPMVQAPDDPFGHQFPKAIQGKTEVAVLFNAMMVKRPAAVGNQQPLDSYIARNPPVGTIACLE